MGLPPISHVHAKMLAWMLEFADRAGRTPTVREIVGHEGVGRSAIVARLAILAGRGLLKTSSARGVAFTGAGRAAALAYRAGTLAVLEPGPQPADQPCPAVRRYLARDAAGWSEARIAAHYGVTRQAVNDALTRWRSRAVAQEVAAEVGRAARPRNFVVK